MTNQQPTPEPTVEATDEWNAVVNLGLSRAEFEWLQRRRRIIQQREATSGDLWAVDIIDSLIATATALRAELAAATADVESLSRKHADGPCYYCGEMTNGGAGNPGLWPVVLSHGEENDFKPVPHHARCVYRRLAELAEVRKAVAEKCGPIGISFDRTIYSECLFCGERYPGFEGDKINHNPGCIYWKCSTQTAATEGEL